MTPQDIMSKLLEPGFEGDSALTFALQSEFHRGFPFENLRPLLTSDNLHTQAAAAFLVAEISSKISYKMNCVVAEIADLLDSEVSGIRFDAIEALLGCTTPADGAILGRVMLRLDDEHAGVRWRATEFIRFAGRWQLRLAVENAATLRPDSAFPILAKAHGQHFRATTKGYGGCSIIRTRLCGASVQPSQSGHAMWSTSSSWQWPKGRMMPKSERSRPVVIIAI